MNNFEVAKYFFYRLSEFPAVKITAGIFIWLLHLLFGSVFRPAYGAVIILWLCDTGTGYYHAWKNPAIKPESRRMYHGLVKLLIYYCLLMVGHQIGQCGFEMTTLVQTVIEIAILLTEGKSIVENLQKIAALKGKEIPVLNFVERLLQGKIEELDGKEPKS